MKGERKLNMNKKYELIEPTNERIDLFNSLWSTESKEDSIELFKNGDIYEFENIYRSNSEKDVKISSALNESRIKDFFIQINSTYHTRITNIDDLSRRLSEEYKSIEDFKDKDIDAFISDCKKCGGRYEYSFATKVFSFVNGDKYPILDSNVSTLLMEYLKYKGYNVKKSSWGKYSKYIEDYKVFMKKYGINKSYKEIDVFLWTYADLLQRYWKEQLGVLSFESVQYKVEKK